MATKRKTDPAPCRTWNCKKKGKHPATDHPDTVGGPPLTDVMDRLPRVAWVVEPATRQLAWVRRGVQGYYPAGVRPRDEDPEELAARLNKDWGVTTWQAEAMLIGSMMGFDVPGADPAYLEASAKEPKAA